MNCSVTLGVNTLSNCLAEGTPSTLDPAALRIYPGDLVEQILGWTTPSSDVGLVIPTGPNTTNGDGGLSSITIDTFGSRRNTGFHEPPHRRDAQHQRPEPALHQRQTGIYCPQANTNPTTHIENCTTGPDQPSYTITNSSEIFTGDPIVPGHRL